MNPPATRNKKETISHKKLIDLFSLFVLGTVSFVTLVYLPKNSSISWWGSLLSALNIIVIFSYFSVAYYLIIHYLSRGKEKLLIHFNEHRKDYYRNGIWAACILYILIELISGGWLNGVKAILLVVITLLSSGPISKWITKLIEKKLPGNRDSENKRS